MQKISKAMEGRLLRAVDSAIDLMQRGEAPTAAVVKAAREAGLPRGGVEKLAHAVNTGRTTRQREDNETIPAKTAEFPLADAEAAIAILFPSEIKSAAAVAQAAVVSPQYFDRPITPEMVARDKAAAACGAMPALGGRKSREYKAEPTHALRQAYGSADRFKQETEESRRKASAAYDKMAASFCRLAEHCARPSAHPLDVFRRNIEIMHGKAAGVIVDQLVKAAPGLVQMEHHKTAGATHARCSLAPAIGPAYDEVVHLLAAVRTHHQLAADYESVKQGNEARTAVALAPFVRTPGDLSVNDPGFPTLSQLHGSLMQSAEQRKQAELDAQVRVKKALPSAWQTLGAGVLAKGMFDSFANDMKAPETDKLVQKTLNKLTDPEHENKLRAINTQATLQDFILNDPVISGHDPEEVMNAFNEITQLSPSMADQRLPLQSMLRKRLQQGSLDTFDVGQALQLEQGLRQRNLMPKPLGTIPGP